MLVANLICVHAKLTRDRQPSIQRSTGIGAGSGVPGGAQAPPELFLAPPEPFEPPLTIKTIMH